MKDFFKKVLSAESPESSKRVASFLTLFVVLILSFMAAFNKDWIVPEFIFDGLCLLAGGGLTLTVVEKIFSKKDGNAEQN